MASGFLFAVSALAFIYALSVIGPTPNPNWHMPVAWVCCAFFAAVGLLFLGAGISAALDEPID
jgi:hypothetical protein